MSMMKLPSGSGGGVFWAKQPAANPAASTKASVLTGELCRHHPVPARVLAAIESPVGDAQHRLAVHPVGRSGSEADGDGNARASADRRARAGFRHFLADPAGELHR